MDYTQTIGAKTGCILPTGQAADTLGLEDGRNVAITICDVANPCVFVRAEDVGLMGSELPDAFAADPALIQRLREVRGKAAERIGFRNDWRDVDRQSPGLPLLVVVTRPCAYTSMRGETVVPDRTDLQARLIWSNKCHESMAGTGSICTAAASRIPGSIVHDVIGADAAATDRLRIGHPMGVLSVNIQAVPSNELGAVAFSALSFSRTARRIMDGFVYVPRVTLRAID